MPQNSHTDLKQKTISGFFWRLLERICAQLVTFVVTVVLARLLMPQEFGLVAIVNVFVAIAKGVQKRTLERSKEDRQRPMSLPVLNFRKMPAKNFRF